MLGIIDIGSNTVRLIVYEKRDGEYRKRHGQKEFMGLLNFVKDGRLNGEGMSRLWKTLREMKQLSDDLHCDRLSCFATASLRGLENQQEVLEQIEEKTGLIVRVLSGEEEARCDYLGLRQAIGPLSGAACDLGGGSCQLFSFDTKEMLSSASLPLGCLKLTNRFQQGAHLTEPEARMLAAYVTEELEACPALRNQRTETFYLIGGAGRAMAKAHRHLMYSERPVDGYTLGRREAEQLAAALFCSPDLARITLAMTAPERSRIFLTGLFTLLLAATHFDAAKLCVTGNGVREGYLQLLLEE